MTEYVVPEGMARSIFNNKYSRRKPTREFVRIAMILSAYDQIMMDRRCDQEKTCMGSSVDFRAVHCQCYRDAISRVERGEADAREEIKNHNTGVDTEN